MESNKSTASKVDNFLRQFIRIPSLLGGILILLSALIIVYDVVTRFFGGSTYWAGEVTGYFLIIMTFLGGGFALQTGKHVQVTFVIEKFPESINKYLDGVVKVLIVIVSLCLLYFGIITVVGFFESNYLSATMLSLPLAYPYAAIPVGAFFLIVEVIREALDLFSSKGGKQ